MSVNGVVEDVVKKNALELQKQIDDIVTTEGLTPFEVIFVQEAARADVATAMVNAKKRVNKKISIEDAKYLATNMMTKSKVKRALAKISGAISAQTAHSIVNSGQKVAGLFKDLSTSSANIDRLENSLLYYDSKIAQAMFKAASSDENEAREADGVILHMMQLRDSAIKTMQKQNETVRKNLALIHEMTGESKAKTIVTSGALNVVLGDATITNSEKEESKEALEAVEVIVKDIGDDLPDIDEIE